MALKTIPPSDEEGDMAEYDDYVQDYTQNTQRYRRMDGNNIARSFILVCQDTVSCVGRYMRSACCVPLFLKSSMVFSVSVSPDWVYCGSRRRAIC